MQFGFYRLRFGGPDSIPACRSLQWIVPDYSRRYDIDRRILRYTPACVANTRTTGHIGWKAIRFKSRANNRFFARLDSSYYRPCRFRFILLQLLIAYDYSFSAIFDETDEEHYICEPGYHVGL